MTIQETDVRGQNYNDAIDSNTSDVDGSSDKGTETNFVNAMGINPDSNVMTIQETNLGYPLLNEWKYVDTFTSTTVGWTETGTSPYLGAVDTSNYIITKTQNAVERWFTFADTTATGGTLVVNLSIYVTTGDGNDDVTWGIDTTGDNTAEFTGTFANPTSGWYNTSTIAALDTVAEVNTARVSFTYVRSSPANNIGIDAARLGVYRAATFNYNIDFEYQFTGANFTQDNEHVCFYVTSHTGSETLNVNYRNGVSWTNLGSITTTGWTNLTATGLTAATYTIQLIGDTEASDSFQDSWNIDLIKLHCWNNSNYQIDFEYNWTGVNFILSMENLGLYVVSHTGSENLNVYYWTGSTWSFLGTITTTGWSNFTATGLTSSTYTIQLKGAIESGDLVQDSWNIDLIMLHTWNTSGGLHGQNWTIWSNALNPDSNSPWSWNFNFPKGVGYYEFYSVGRYAGTVEGAPASADGRCRKT